MRTIKQPIQVTQQQPVTKNDQKFGIFSFILLAMFLLFLLTEYKPIAHVKADTETPETQQTVAYTEVETYTYKITYIDSQGYNGKALNSDTGIFFTAENVYNSDPNLQLHENDVIRVTFPAGDYETILNIEKVE